MTIKHGKSLRSGLFFSLTLLAFAVVAGQPSGGTKPGESVKIPAPTIDGFWQTNVVPRALFIFGEHFQPPGALPPIVKIGGKPSLFSHVITDSMLIAMPLPQQPAKGSITVETRAGSPPKTVGRTISPVKLGAVTGGLTISGIWPHHGSAGTLVFVFGSGFASDKTRVTVNQTPAPLIQIIDQSLLIAQVPVGASSGAISVKMDSRRAKSKTAFGIQ
jgi:hypothetical protein